MTKCAKPPVALRPYRVPWGPRSISTRSMSKSMKPVPDIWLMYTSSRYTATGLSTLVVKSLLATPRMAMA